MNRIVIVILLVLFSKTLFAETLAGWDRLTVVSNEFVKPLKVSIENSDGLLSELSVFLAEEQIYIPKRATNIPASPNLSTLTIGYTDSSKLDFYIAFKCGIFSSNPKEKSPKIIFFIFKNGKYLDNEIYNWITSLDLSLEAYRLINSSQIKK